MSIRKAVDEDIAQIKSCLAIVINATYGGLWSPEPLVVPDRAWGQAWIACTRDKIVGVGLSERDRVSDLWVHPEAQGKGAGSALLAFLEQEIAARGHSVARLRCLESNLKSRAFYASRGWAEVRVYPHEAIPLNTVDMEKPVVVDGDW